LYFSKKKFDRKEKQERFPKMKKKKEKIFEDEQ
jgi:hypothetical protein